MTSFTCPTCAKLINNCNSISCDNCDSWHHLICTNIDEQTFNLYINDKTKCTNCSDCKMKLKPISSSINCDNCNIWVHLKCSGLTKERFLSLSNSEDQWYCRNCTRTIFPFNSIDNKKLLITMQIRAKSSILTQQIIQIANPYCTKCLKKVCTSCKHLIHKKCCTFNRHDTRLERVCSSCTSEIFPFSNMSDDELIRINFNSNDQCLCGTKPPNSDIRKILDRYNFLN